MQVQNCILESSMLTDRAVGEGIRLLLRNIVSFSVPGCCITLLSLF